MLPLPMRTFREGAPIHDPLHSVALMRGADEGSAIFFEEWPGFIFLRLFSFTNPNEWGVFACLFTTKNK